MKEKKAKEKWVNFGVRLPESMYKQLNSYAKKQYSSLSIVVRQALDKLLREVA